MSWDCYGEDDDNQYEFLEDQEDLNDLEIPDVPWQEDIKKIPDHNLQLEEIRKAEKLLNQEKTLREQLDKGEISRGRYDVIHQDILMPKMWKATTQCGFATVDLTHDDFGDISEDEEFLMTGDLKMTELKDRLKKTIDNIGPDAAQELADRMRDEEKLSEDTYDSINRQIRMARTGKRR